MKSNTFCIALGHCKALLTVDAAADAGALRSKPNLQRCAGHRSGTLRLAARQRGDDQWDTLAAPVGVAGHPEESCKVSVENM